LSEASEENARLRARGAAQPLLSDLGDSAASSLYPSRRASITLWGGPLPGAAAPPALATAAAAASASVQAGAGGV
ncbi:hypothetical protein MNEG_14922, partial [Monoraphidium neglectum]